MEKRTTIFSIFVLLCLLPNSIYARTIEYENPKDTTLDMTLYFDLNARQIDKDYQGNGKTLTVLDSLLANPAHSIHLNSIILVSPDLYNGKKEQGIPLGQKRSEEVKVFLCGKYPQVNTAQICIRKGEEYGDALRKLILDDRLVPDREDVLALIDYHHDNPVKMQDFLQRLDAGIPYQYISDRVLPELRRTEIRVCLSYPEENGGKNSSAEQAARIEETEFIPIDRETTVTPMTMQVLPQKERTQVIIETEKTVIKAEKKKETKEKRGEKPKEKAARRVQTVDNSKYSINSLVYWVTYVHNVVYSFYRSMIYCYINSTQRCAGSIVIDIIPTNGADKRKFFPFAPYFPVTNVIKRYFYPYFPAIIGIKGYSFPYFPYLSGIMKIKTALYSLFSRLDWHKTVVFPCLGEIYEGIRSLSWEIPVT